MSDGFFEQVNKAPRRGAKLRRNGSNPTGDQELSFTPEYSSEGDPAVGATSLNHNVHRANPLTIDKPTMADHELRGEHGLNSKEPLF